MTGTSAIMASIFASGIACAAPIAALAALAAAQPGTAEMAGPRDVASLLVTITGLKSTKGVVKLAICPAGSDFPDCKERAVRTASLKIAGGAAHGRFSDLPAGIYAISVFHDANANGRLDTFLGIPREGYGFSRNPPFHARAPRFSETEMTVNGATETTIAMRYLL
ncbi:MAG: DUF2141 domain-containing protein [Caenibius sp.]